MAWPHAVRYGGRDPFLYGKVFIPADQDIIKTLEGYWYYTDDSRAWTAFDEAIKAKRMVEASSAEIELLHREGKL